MKTLLKIERQKRELTIEEVASELGLSRSGYLNIEAGRRKPSFDLSNRMEDYFGIPALKLLTETEIKEQNF